MPKKVGILPRLYDIFFLLKYRSKQFRKFTVLLSSPERRVCEPCPTIMDIVDFNGECTTCAEGSYPNGERTSCSECKPDEKVNYDGSCKRCPDGFVPNENRRFCKRCPINLIANGGLCIPCDNPDKE